MNAEMGNLSLLQGIFLTQELNWGLLHCRWILYQLSYQESPYIKSILQVNVKWKNDMNSYQKGNVNGSKMKTLTQVSYYFFH